MSSRVLITGAAGLVGANLVRLLLDQGEDVCAMVHRDQRALNGLEVEKLSADVRDPEAMVRIFTGVEVVYHLAGSISIEMDTGQEMTAINTRGTRNVVTACLQCGVRRLVHFSSIEAVRQEPLDQPLDEHRPLIDEPRSSKKVSHIPPYVNSKAQAEREVLAGIKAGLNAVILRPTAMLGPNDYKPSYLGQALIELALGRIPALVKGGFNWVDVRDVAAGAISAEHIAPSGAYYILGGNWHTIREVADLVAAFSSQAAPKITVPMWLADAFAPLMLNVAHLNGTQPIYTRVTMNALKANRHVSSLKAARELGYSTRSLSDTVRDALTWFQENDYLYLKRP